ncbi:hypothetical protein BS78_02G102400 [Paspalum vaginatum]|nr:hypothetical protein BS78_02G102400 [Paspalum vaginatum]
MAHIIKAYEKAVKPMTDRKQWHQVNPGFKLWPSVLKRAARRPRERRYKYVAEGGTKKRTTICKRYLTNKTINLHIKTTHSATPPRANTSVSTPSSVTRRRLLELEAATPTRTITHVQTPSPMTRGYKTSKSPIVFLIVIF